MGLSVFLRLWLCYASKTLHNPTRRLYRFLSTLYACLSRSARAVLQFYPENDVAVDERELDGNLILGDRNNVDKALRSLQKTDSRYNNATREPRESRGKREKKTEDSI
ncbi:uncharacterized protein LOC143896757 [Temnothorax americanus]|uniref:uncharacterized protein LOC143896757 n=1 Tax=Temnothorax americanus TaxID=1964332 RepID=UPI0040692C7A